MRRNMKIRYERSGTIVKLSFELIALRDERFSFDENVDDVKVKHLYTSTRVCLTLEADNVLSIFKYSNFPKSKEYLYENFLSEEIHIS